MSRVADARVRLAQELTAALAGVEVAPYGVSKTLTAPLVFVRAASLARGVVFSSRVVTLDVVVISHLTTAGVADDALDALLDRVLDALDTLDNVVWTTAERGTFEESSPAYTITCTRED